MVRPILAPSILSADFSALGNAVKLIGSAGADWIHIDVMDGRFVPVITFGHKLVADVKKITTLPLDVHLMITDPERQIEAFCRAGADLLTIHYEGNIHHNRLLRQIRDTGCRCGISIVPSTPVELLTELLPELDLVLVMSVNPGYGGQKFIASTLDKILRLSQLRQKDSHQFLISVDGGISELNASDILAKGADVLVTGSAFFNSADPARYIDMLRQSTSSSERVS